MAIDLDAIRNKLNQLSGGGGRRNSRCGVHKKVKSTQFVFCLFLDNDGQPFQGALVLL